jgi:hypothetical protein
VALVEGGSVRVGWPGAPGCTTTGVGSACCAQTASENNPANVTAAIIPATGITDWSLRLPMDDFSKVEGQTLSGPTLSQSSTKFHGVRP